MVKWLGVFFVIFSATQATSGVRELPNFSFASIDGGEIKLDDFKGKVVLVTNTASKCGFTGQYEGLQALYDKYQDEGLVVFGVPSADFRQEYQVSEEVKNFCEVNFGINFPMSEVTKVVGNGSHPFYQWLLEKYNFKPRWNFNKVLISKTGEVVNTFGATVRPTSEKMNAAIVALLKN
jgi:glutathione peroxidase